MGTTPASLRLPDFDLPFPRRMNPFADAVVRHTGEWAHDVGLVPDAADVLAFTRDRIIEAGPRLVPHASLTHACLVSDWTLFLIVLDDEFDERELGSQHDLAAASIAEVLAGSPHARLGGSARALANLRRRFEFVAPTAEWLRRFSAHADEHVHSKVLEAEHRASGQVLDVSGYVALRRVTGAPYPYADLAELAEHARVQEAVRRSHEWNALLDAFADVFLGIQDICSCAKEIATGDDLNLAAVIQRVEGCTLQEALAHSDRWVTERARRFEAEAARLPSRCTALGLDDLEAAEVQRCVRGLEALLGGHLAWNSEDNPRYTT